MSGLLAASVLLGLNATQLLAGAYARVAERLLEAPTGRSMADPARIAAALTPWSAHRAALEGWSRADGQDATAAGAYARALRWAPADAQLWSEYALALGRLGRFGDDATRAVSQARRLAPASPTVRRSIAQHGLIYWQRGSADLRRHWLAAMREELALGRGPFLAHALTRGRARTFCSEPAHILGETRWCTAVAERLSGGCYDVSARGPIPCKTGR